MNKKQKKNLYRIIAALVLVLILKLLPQFPTPVELLLYCIPYLVVGWDVLRKALLSIKKRQHFDECFLMAIATLGAFFLAVWAKSGDYDEEGGRLVATPASNGRFHSDWCSMMYPRLLLARD